MIISRLKRIVVGLVIIILSLTLMSWLIFGIWLVPKVVATLDFNQIYQRDVLRHTTEELLATLMVTHPGITQELSAGLEHHFVLLSDKQFIKEKELLLQNLDRDMSGREYLSYLLPLVSKFGDEHTEIPFFLAEYYPQMMQVKQFPYQLIFEEKQIYFDEDIYLNAELCLDKGVEILAINGIPSDRISLSLMEFFSGFNSVQKYNYLRQYYAQALYIMFGEAAITVTTVYGDLSIVPRLPESRKDNPYSYTIRDGALYFTLRDFVDNSDFHRFLEDMFSEAEDMQVGHLIIDLRDSRGGASAAGDWVISYLTDDSTQQLLSSHIKVSEVSKAYFLSFLPSALRWTFLQYYIPPLSRLFQASVGDSVEIKFTQTKNRNKMIFNGSVEIWINAGTMSSADLLYHTIENYDLGLVVGEKKSNVNHFGNQVLYTAGSGVRMFIPTSFNIAYRNTEE